MSNLEAVLIATVQRAVREALDGRMTKVEAPKARRGRPPLAKTGRRPRRVARSGVAAGRGAARTTRRYSKLNAEIVRDIFKASRAGESVPKLARKYKVSLGTVYNIVNGRTWGEVTRGLKNGRARQSELEVIEIGDVEVNDEVEAADEGEADGEVFEEDTAS